MNRTFGITGFLAAGMTVLWVWFVIGLPWFPIYSSRSPAASMWFLWATVSAIGIGTLFLFARSSLTAHWAALRRNAPIPSVAWRGVFGVYLLVMLAFALPVLSGDPSGTHRTEMYLYICLAGICLALSSVAIRRGFCRVTRDSTVSDTSFP